jgi:dihydropteroate synthase
MGVINTTPDSFSDGGTLYRGSGLDLELCMQRARAMVAEGAHILDVGGESTRPGAKPVSEQEEMDRVAPVVAAILAELDVAVSVDTSSPPVMRESMALGASIINDIRALSRPGALEAAAETGATVCLMHMQGTPDTMQTAPTYSDVVAEVTEFLGSRVQACTAAGILGERIWIDPGFGFGKSLRHNLELLQGLPRLCELGYPVLVGLSRKSMIGTLLGREPAERLPASLGLAVLAAERGARIIRTHDVAATADAVAMATALAELADRGGVDPE